MFSKTRVTENRPQQAPAPQATTTEAAPIALPERGSEDEQGQSGDPRMREHAGEPKGRHGALSWHA